MVVHLKKSGWLSTMCGLRGDHPTTAQEASATCGNCLRSASTAGLSQAWKSTKRTLRTFYVQRAGFRPERGLQLLKAKPDTWTRKEQNMIARQLASNPELARLLNQPFTRIERGGSGDNRTAAGWEWQMMQLRERGRCCPHCGGMV